MITVCVSSNQSAIYIYIWTEKERNHVYLEIMEYSERMGFRLTLIRNLRVFFSFDNNKVQRIADDCVIFCEQLKTSCCSTRCNTGFTIPIEDILFDKMICSRGSGDFPWAMKAVGERICDENPR